MDVRRQCLSMIIQDSHISNNWLKLHGYKTRRGLVNTAHRRNVRFREKAEYHKRLRTQLIKQYYHQMK